MYNQNVEINSDIMYNKNDPEYIGLIAADPEIERYAKYSMLKEWLNKPLPELKRISKMLSQVSIDKKNQGLTESEYNDIDGKTVYKYDIIDDEYKFSVKNMYKYTNEMEENYENYVDKNNRSTISNELQRQGNKFNSNVVLPNNEQSTTNDRLFREEFKQWENKKRNNRASNKNKIRELDNNSSFSLDNQSWQEYLDKNYKPTGTRNS